MLSVTLNLVRQIKRSSRGPGFESPKIADFDIMDILLSHPRSKEHTGEMINSLNLAYKLI